MMKKLFFGSLVALTSVLGQAQTISITGGQFDWGGSDVDLIQSTTDSNYYTIDGLSLNAGEIKFRENHSWSNSWGSNNFPAGGSDGNNITIPTTGTYNVTFNKSNGVYTFTTAGYPVISLIGQNIGTAWETDVDMNTADGINYTLSSYSMPAGEFKFRTLHVWSASYGSGDNAFPTGNATYNGGNINASTAGTYNVSFNRNTGAYAFVQTMAVSNASKKQVLLNTLVKDELKFNEEVKAVQIYSVDGKMVNAYQNVKTINLSTISKGAYILKIVTASNETLSQKIIKN